jgi:glycosyltransferase involved in cell wall biosynthesis
MDAFLISSDTEQMPVALLEAMASRLPVVASDVGDVRAILPAPQGELVVAADAERLAAAMHALYALPAAARVQLGAANRRRVEEDFTFAGMVRAYREVYGGALG